MPVLQVFEPIVGSQFHGKYFVDIVGLESGRGGPKLSNYIADAKIMTKDECQAIAETWSAWHTFKVVEEPKNIERRIYKHGIGFVATCPECNHHKRLLNCRDIWWFICPCGYKIELGNTQAVNRRLTSA